MCVMERGEYRVSVQKTSTERVNQSKYLMDRFVITILVTNIVCIDT